MMRSFHSECRQCAVIKHYYIPSRIVVVIIPLLCFVYTDILFRHKNMKRNSPVKNISTARDRFISHFLVHPYDS